MPLAESIDRLRALFEEELVYNPTAYHSIDIERVRTEEWQVKRFLLEHQSDQQKAFEALCKTLKWKMTFGLHLRTDQYFPKEMWTLNGMEMTGRDRKGRLIVWSHSKYQGKFKDINFQKLLQHFAAHRMELADRAAGETGCIMVGDSKGVSLLNIDRDLANFNVELADHYPLLTKAFYVVNLPVVLNSCLKLLLGFTSAKNQSLVHLVSVEQLAEVIDSEHIPVRLNGKRVVEVYPDGLVPLEERYQELGLEEKFVNHIYKTFNLKRTTN